MTNEERIKADAEAYANGIGDVYRKYAAQYGYIAGATAENAHMQPVIDAAEKVAKIFAHDGEHGTCAICQLVRALEQWKSGKGKDEPKRVASNCGMCGKLGKNQYLGNQLYLCDECFEDYEKGKEVGDA